MTRSTDLPFPFSLLADRSFQAAEVRRVIALSSLYLAVTTALVGLFYARLLDTLVDGVAPLLFVSEDARLAVEAVPALGEVLGRWLLVMLAVNVIVTLGVSLFVARRLGRPILALKRTLREVGAGNLDVRLRASDKREFGEIADELERAMRSVRAQVAAAKSGIERGAAPAADALERERALEECRSALAWFQVDDAPAPAAGPRAV